MFKKIKIVVIIHHQIINIQQMDIKTLATQHIKTQNQLEIWLLVLKVKVHMMPIIME